MIDSRVPTAVVLRAPACRPVSPTPFVDLTSFPKPLYLDDSTSITGAGLGTHRHQRNQSDHRFDEKERPSVFEIEKDGFRLKLQKGVADQTSVPVPVAVASPSKTVTTTAKPLETALFRD